MVSFGRCHEGDIRRRIEAISVGQRAEQTDHQPTIYIHGIYIAVLSLTKREVLGEPRRRKGFLASGDWCKLALWAEKTVPCAHAPATGIPLCFRVSRGPPCGQQPRMTRPGLPDQ